MSISESYTERLDKELREITGPLMEQLKDIDGEIEGMATELSELRAHRTKLITIARQINPELVPKKVTVKKEAATISDEKVAEVWAWLRTNVNGDEFYASGILKRDDFDVTSQSQLSKALVALHDRGNIRLVRQGSGGSKHYKLVTS